LCEQALLTGVSRLHQYITSATLAALWVVVVDSKVLFEKLDKPFSLMVSKADCCWRSQKKGVSSLQVVELEDLQFRRRNRWIGGKEAGKAKEDANIVWY
jgi:hypothetical protein